MALGLQWHRALIPWGADWLRHGLTTPWVRTVAVLVAAQVVSEIGFNFAVPFQSLFLQELGLRSLSEVEFWSGLTVGAFALMMSAMAPVWGFVADRFGYRLMIQRALFGAGIAIGLISIVHSPGELLLLRVLQGVSTGAVPAIAVFASLQAPHKHLGAVLGMLQAAQFLGMSLGPLLGGIFADRFGLRAAFAGTGLILIATGLLITALTSETRHATGRALPGAADPDAVAGPRLLGHDVLVIIGLSSLTQFAMMTPQPFLPLFVQRLLPSEDGLATTVGVMLAATAFSSMVGALLVGRLSRRYGLRTSLIGCLAVSAVLSALQVGVGSVWQLIPLRLGLGLAQGVTGPATQALLIDATPPAQRGAAFGLLTMASSAGNGVGPVLGSAVVTAFGIQAVFLSTAPAFGLAGWVLSRLARRPTATGWTVNGSSVQSHLARSAG